MGQLSNTWTERNPVMHIMLLLDDSRYAAAIIKWVRGFPHPDGTRLTLFHVLEPLDVPEEFAARPAIQSRQRAAAEDLLSRATRELEKVYGDVKVSIVEGFPIYEILRAIREKQPDVVVSGTRGLRGAKGLALGSVSQRLLTYAPCSVMLVPAKPRATRRLKVALATDGSKGAKVAAYFLTLLPDLKEIIVMTTVRPVEAREIAASRETLKMAAGAVRAELSRARRATAEKAIEETATVLRPSGVVVKCRVLAGHPAEAIPREAAKQRSDLLVLGSRGLTGQMALAMGSISLALAQSATRPVLVVKRRV